MIKKLWVLIFSLWFLISLLWIIIALMWIQRATAGETMECEPQRVTGDNRHWAFRIVNGRHCWYPGRPGKPKEELYWRAVPAGEAERHESDSPPPFAPVAAPATTIYDMTPEEIEAVRDRLLENTCCWPELKP